MQALYLEKVRYSTYHLLVSQNKQQVRCDIVLSYQVGNIKFIRARRKKEEKENIVDDFEAFQGKGQSLRKKSKK